MLDVFFLSYAESFADERYYLLLDKAPHAKRVHGVQGFFNAHRRCAELSLTYNFYVVDADAILLDDFDFSFTPSKINKIYNIPESDNMFVWRSKNPINDLIYGYGGVKLIPKLPVLRASDLSGKIVDFTTGCGLNIFVKDQISNITGFNYDEFSTWRSAFRECAKLASNITNESSLKSKVGYDQDVLDRVKRESEERLEIWCSIGVDREYGEYAIQGAISGKQYGIKNADSPIVLANINDYTWMKNEFKKQTGINSD